MKNNYMKYDKNYILHEAKQIYAMVQKRITKQQKQAAAKTTKKLPDKAKVTNVEEKDLTAVIYLDDGSKVRIPYTMQSDVLKPVLSLENKRVILRKHVEELKNRQDIFFAVDSIADNVKFTPQQLETLKNLPLRRAKKIPEDSLTINVAKAVFKKFVIDVSGFDKDGNPIRLDVRIRPSLFKYASGETKYKNTTLVF